MDGNPTSSLMMYTSKSTQRFFTNPSPGSAVVELSSMTMFCYGQILDVPSDESTATVKAQ